MQITINTWLGQKVTTMKRSVVFNFFLVPSAPRANIYIMRLTTRCLVEETPVAIPLISTAQLVGHVGAPIAVLSDHAELVLARSQYFTSLIVFRHTSYLTSFFLIINSSENTNLFNKVKHLSSYQKVSGESELVAEFESAHEFILSKS